MVFPYLVSVTVPVFLRVVLVSVYVYPALNPLSVSHLRCKILHLGILGDWLSKKRAGCVQTSVDQVQTYGHIVDICLHTSQYVTATKAVITVHRNNVSAVCIVLPSLISPLSLLIVDTLVIYICP